MSLVERLRDGIDHAKAFKAGDVLWACPALPAPEGEIRLSDVESLVERFRTLEAELSKAREREQRLQAALAFWMPGVTDSIEFELNGRAGDDAQLLVVFEGEVPQTSWGDTVLGRLSKAREAKASPDEIAAAWNAWHSRHGGKLGPGPAFVEAINAAFAIRSLSKKEG